MINPGPEFLRCCSELLEQSKRERFVIVKDFKIDVDGFKGLVKLVQRLVDRELGLLESRRKFSFRYSHCASSRGALVRAASVFMHWRGPFTSITEQQQRTQEEKAKIRSIFTDFSGILGYLFRRDIYHCQLLFANCFFRRYYAPTKSFHWEVQHETRVNPCFFAHRCCRSRASHEDHDPRRNAGRPGDPGHHQ